MVAQLPRRPSAPPGPDSTTRARRLRAEMQVRRSGRHTVLVTAGVSAGVVASVVAYMVVDAAGSVLPAALGGNRRPCGSFPHLCALRCPRRRDRQPGDVALRDRPPGARQWRPARGSLIAFDR